MIYQSNEEMSCNKIINNNFSFFKKQINVNKKTYSYKNLCTVDLTNFGASNSNNNNNINCNINNQQFLNKNQLTSNNIKSNESELRNNINYNYSNSLNADTAQKTKLNRNYKIFIPENRSIINSIRPGSTNNLSYGKIFNQNNSNNIDISQEVESHMSTNNNSPKDSSNMDISDSSHMEEDNSNFSNSTFKNNDKKTKSMLEKNNN